MRLAAASLAIIGAAILPASAADHPDVQDVLAWLPPDTETVIAANGPFILGDLVSAASPEKPLETPSPKELKSQVQSPATELLSLEISNLVPQIGKSPLLFALEGSRHVRAPKGLGLAPFEGCVIAVFSEPPAIDSDALAHRAKRVETIEGLPAAVFEDQLEKDIWTTYVVLPQKNVLLVATNADFLRTVIRRMRQVASPRALPESLAEWKYVNTSAPAWGVRHYQKTGSLDDPTSPFHGKDAANIPDPQAAGATFWFDASDFTLKLTYLSANTGARKIVSEFLGLNGAAGGAYPVSRVAVTQPGPGALQYSLPLAIPRSLALVPLLGLTAIFGHAVFM